MADELAPSTEDTQDDPNFEDALTESLSAEYDAPAPEAEADTDTETNSNTDTDTPEPTPEATDGDAPQDADTDAGSPDADDTDSPSFDAPARWDAKGREVWATLNPEQQEHIAEREKVLQSYQTQTSMQLAETRRALGQKTEADALLTETITALRAKLDPLAEFSEAQLYQYALQGPEQQAQVADVLQQRQAMTALQAEAERREAAEYETFVRDEFATLQTLDPELTDPQTGKDKLAGVYSYLGQQGYDADTLRHAAASDLSLAHKAMKWDALQAAKTKAKPAPARSGKGTRPQPAQTGKLQQKARRKAFADIDSTDALADALALELADELADLP